MFPVQNGLICWLDAMDGKAGDTLLKDRTSYGHNLIVENFQQGYGFTRTSIKVKQSKFNTSNNNALYIANGGFKTSCKSFCICIERHNTNQPWYIFDGRGLDGQGLSTNHCFNGNTGSSYDNSKTRRDGVLTYNNSNLDINKKTFLYFELKEAELFTLSILMRCSKNENTEGEFYSLYAYNRALTEEEILQNMEYENNKISYVNETNLPKIVDKLSNASNIKIVNNKYGNRVQTVIDKIVEKADDVTKAIKQEVINDGYSFKVGTGNVDVSTDVEDGFGEVGVKGVTYQNIAYKNENIPSNCSYSKETGEGVINYNASHLNGFNFSKDLLKPNTLYTVIINIKENSLVTTSGKSLKLQMAENNTAKYVANGFVGQLKATISTKEISSSFGIVTVTAGATEGRVVFDGYMVLEGDHVDKSNIPSKISNIVGVGNKSKNLFDGKNVSIGYLTATGAINASGTTCRVTDYIEVKSNTSYTVNNPAGETHCFYDSDKNFISYVGAARTFITPANCKYVRCTIKRTDYDSTFQLEEGTKATPYEPYYDGHKIEILSHGKNLYKPNLQTKSANGLTFSLHGNTLIVNGTCTKIVDFRPVTTTLELYTYVNKLPIETTLNLSNNLGLKNYFSLKRNGVQTYLANTLIIQEGDYDIGCFVRFEEGQSYNNTELKIQLEINNVATEYAPYIEDKTQILLDEPLMRLPNGVCDEITRDGKLIRRVGKVVLKGNEWWTKYDNINDQEEGYSIYLTQLPNKNYYREEKINILGDNFASVKFRNGKGEYIYSDGWNPNMFLKIKDSRLTSSNVEVFKQWLSQNPTTVYYELKEPIITELPAPYLRIFKDGHLTFNTLVAPESNHVVQLNKSAQIERSIREVQSLDSRVGKLESFYDDMMLETSHKLSLLNYDFEYTRERNGE